MMTHILDIINFLLPFFAFGVWFDGCVMCVLRDNTLVPQPNHRSNALEVFFMSALSCAWIHSARCAVRRELSSPPEIPTIGVWSNGRWKILSNRPPLRGIGHHQ